MYISEPFIVIDDFLSVDAAKAMRADIEAHFSNPSNHHKDSHQIWNYWHVPDQYMYLRTTAENVIRAYWMDDFNNALRSWSASTLGLAKVTLPYLSLYVDGCSQGLHNDSRNGRFAFVYSLTKDERKSIGGRTILLREGDLFRKGLRKANAGRGLHELLEPKFNRLVVFDDRLVHGVERVTGSMDPMEGRWVLHGHIEEAGPIIAGSLTLEKLREGICVAADQFVVQAAAAMQLYHGPLVVKFDVMPNGKTANIGVLLDRVVSEHEGDVDWELLKALFIQSLGKATFPMADGKTSVTLPIAFGGPLRAVSL
jgi:hypothetical protein